MTLPLTPETLAAAYDYLATTPPFNKWSLPDSDEIKFVVGRFRDTFATYQWDGKHSQHIITMSAVAIGQTTTLMQTLAHEMIHLHLEESKMESRGSTNTHNLWFRKFAAQVCKYHGWDLKAFY